jgi:sugar phosphate isomerase/epimerase
MADKSHLPFTDPKPQLTCFLNKLEAYGYDGPITLELAHSTPVEEIAKTKLLFDKLLAK